MRATYFSAPAIRSLRSIPFNSVLKAGGFSRAGTERAWLEKTGLFLARLSAYEAFCGVTAKYEAQLTLHEAALRAMKQSLFRLHVFYSLLR